MHIYPLLHPHRGRFLALCTTIGLMLSCLNPDISDEEPITETAAALGAPDAGSAAFEPSRDTADDDTPSADTPPDDEADTTPSDDTVQPPRRERGRRNPFGR